MSIHVHDIVLPAKAREHVLWLSSDEHIGAASTAYDKLQADLAIAKRRKARMLFNGDLLDAITPGDKRFGCGVLHPRVAASDDCLGAAIEWAIELLRPYKRSIDFIGSGNHPDKVLQRVGFDPIASICERLKAPPGGYTGLVRYSLEGASAQFTLAYSHGSGGGSGLAGALGEFDKKGGFFEGVNAIWFGHRHVRVVSQVERLECRPNSGPGPGPAFVKRRQWLLRTGGYVDAYRHRSSDERHRSGNYLTDELCAPYGMGGLFLVLTPSQDGCSFDSRVEMS